MRRRRARRRHETMTTRGGTARQRSRHETTDKEQA
jgi:hypothetical protein